MKNAAALQVNIVCRPREAAMTKRNMRCQIRFGVWNKTGLSSMESENELFCTADHPPPPLLPSRETNLWLQQESSNGQLPPKI